MIPPVAGWRARHGEREVRLVPDEAPGLAAIVYRERCRPLRDPFAILGDTLLGLPGRVVAIGPARPVVTAEGERGLLVTVELEGERCVVGLVAVDDFYAFTVGRARDPAWFERLLATVEHVVTRDEHQLTSRPRRTAIRPPAGWTRSSRAGSQVWTGPTMELVAPPAVPLRLGVPLSAYLEAHGRPGTGLRVAGRSPVRAIVTPTEGLEGSLAVSRDGETGWVRWAAVLRDARYVYGLHVDARAAQADEARRVLDAAVASLVPLFPFAAPSLFTHWAA